MDLVISVIILTGIVLASVWWVRNQWGNKRVAQEMDQLGLSPEELAGLSKDERVAKVADAQEDLRDSLAEMGLDHESCTPEIGVHVAWKDVVRQVFRVLEFDRAGTTITRKGKVKAVSRKSPYGYLLVGSPILNQPARLPIVHRDDFVLATTVFDEPDAKEILETSELLVTYAPKRTLPDGRMAHPAHALHYVLTPPGTLERYYDFENDLHMASPAPEKLFGPFIYKGDIRVKVSERPNLEHPKTVEQLEEELARARSDAAKARADIARTISALKPPADAKSNPPPFDTWWESYDESANLDEALGIYVSMFGLVEKEDAGEFEGAAVARAKLRALASSDIDFDGEDAETFGIYKMSLMGRSIRRDISRSTKGDE